METLSLEQKIRETFQAHLETGGIISSPDRLIASVIDGLDKWLENEQTNCQKDRADQARPIATRREPG